MPSKQAWRATWLVERLGSSIVVHREKCWVDPPFLKNPPTPHPTVHHGLYGLLLSSRFVFPILIELSSERVKKTSIRIIHVPKQGHRGHNLTNVWGQLVSTAFCFLFLIQCIYKYTVCIYLISDEAGIKFSYWNVDLNWVWMQSHWTESCLSWWSLQTAK